MFANASFEFTVRCEMIVWTIPQMQDSARYRRILQITGTESGPLIADDYR